LVTIYLHIPINQNNRLLPWREIPNINENGYPGSIHTGKGGWYARMPDEKKVEYVKYVYILIAKENCNNSDY
jgi:hypothetical protein